MTGDTPGVVIIGGGLAGARCATTLRSLGEQRSIQIFGDEPDMPYERPALSKQYLAGTRGVPDLALVSPAQLAQQNITMHPRSDIACIDYEARAVADLRGRSTSYASLVIATGARARTLAGSSRYSNVITLRARRDADRLRPWCGAGHHLVIIGCGFVGAEVASTVLSMGGTVTVLESGAAPYESLLGIDAGNLLLNHYRSHGVDVRTRTLVVGVEGAGGLAREVVLGDGTRISCDAVLVSIGAIARDELFWSIGATAPIVPIAGGGIPVDDCGRTGLADIYACGDVAAWWREHEHAHLRIEHFTDAAAQGVAVAHAIAGATPPPLPVPFVWSEQFGLRLQFAGRSRLAHAIDVESATPASLLVRYRDEQGRTVGVLGANRPRDIAHIRRELAAA